MTEPDLREDGLVVTDDVLPAEHFRALCREVAYGDYRWVHAQKWDKAWRAWDGQPLRGESVYYDPKGVFGWRGATYPTATPVDALIDAVRTAAASFADVVGVEGRDWVALYLSPWLYPVGSALSLHRDADLYSGSFTFFAHPRWSVHWGGELLAHRSFDGSAGTIDPMQSGDEPWMTDEATADFDGSGIATCVAPRPNRLVLIGPDRPHRIARVDQNAGARVRASIAGFFLRSP